MRTLRLVIVFLLVDLQFLSAQVPAIGTVIDSVIYHARKTALNAHLVKWDSLRARMNEHARQAKTVDGLRASLEELLNALRDADGQFTNVATGAVIASYGPVSTAAENEFAPAMDFRVLENGIGYLRPAAGDDIETNATAIRKCLDSLSANPEHRWIIDLRDIGSDRIEGVLAGLAPLIGEGQIGALADGKGRVRKLLEIHNGNFYDDQRIVVRFPSTEPWTHARVAVLMNAGTARGGEILAIALKGRSNTRFFGEGTRGDIAVVKKITVAGIVTMSLTESQYQDRKGRIYRGSIKPDVVAGDDVLEEAKSWLLQPEGAVVVSSQK